MSYLAEQDRQQRITLLVILALGSLMIWHAPFGALLLYPFTILSTWFHEMGHGLSAILMGERFDSLVIYPDGSGVAMSLVSPDRTALQDAIIAANTAEEEHKAELAQGAEAAIGDDPLAAVEGETHGTDADAGEYLNEEAKDGE